MADADELHGMIPYLATPTDKSGAIDRAMLRRLCGHLIDQGVHALAPLGSAGEFPYLGFSEREQVVATVVEAAAGRVPVLAGVAATTINDAVAQTERWRSLGADGIVGILEAYFPLRYDGVEAYFTAIADAASAPVVLYIDPNYQGSDLSLPVVERLSNHPYIRFMTDASSNTGRLLSILNRTEGRLGVFAASTHVTTAAMLIGGCGSMSGVCCVAPRQCVELYDLCRAGDWSAAMALQRRLWHISEVFSRFSVAAVVKAGLALQGFDCGDPLRPQAALGSSAIQQLRKELEAVGSLKEPE